MHAKKDSLLGNEKEAKRICISGTRTNNFVPSVVLNSVLCFPYKFSVPILCIIQWIHMQALLLNSILCTCVSGNEVFVNLHSCKDNFHCSRIAIANAYKYRGILSRFSRRIIWQLLQTAIDKEWKQLHQWALICLHEMAGAVWLVDGQG